MYSKVFLTTTKRRTHAIIRCLIVLSGPRIGRNGTGRTSLPFLLNCMTWWSDIWSWVESSFIILSLSLSRAKAEQWKYRCKNASATYPFSYKFRQPLNSRSNVLVKLQNGGLSRRRLRGLLTPNHFCYYIGFNITIPDTDKQIVVRWSSEPICTSWLPKFD